MVANSSVTATVSVRDLVTLVVIWSVTETESKSGLSKDEFSESDIAAESDRDFVILASNVSDILM